MIESINNLAINSVPVTRIVTSEQKSSALDVTYAHRASVNYYSSELANLMRQKGMDRQNGAYIVKKGRVSYEMWFDRVTGAEDCLEVRRIDSDSRENRRELVAYFNPFDNNQPTRVLLREYKEGFLENVRRINPKVHEEEDCQKINDNFQEVFLAYKKDRSYSEKPFSQEPMDPLFNEKRLFRFNAQRLIKMLKSGEKPVFIYNSSQDNLYFVHEFSDSQCEFICNVIPSEEGINKLNISLLRGKDRLDATLDLSRSYDLTRIVVHEKGVRAKFNLEDYKNFNKWFTGLYLCGVQKKNIEAVAFGDVVK